MYSFKNLANILENKKIRVVYQALAKSIINYGISVWGGAYDTTIDPLKKIQNKILKIIFKKNPMYHTETFTKN